MKQRIISAAVAIIICVFPLIFGGILLDILLGFCLSVAAYEFAKLPNKKFDLFVFLALMFFSVGVLFFYEKTLALIMVYIVLIFAYSLFNEYFGLDDVCATVVMSIIIAVGLYNTRHVFAIGKGLVLWFILLSSLVCDAAAYFVGMKFGKHKLIERISPKKTIEGAIGGYLIAVIVSFVFVYCFDYLDYPSSFMIIMCLTMPLVSMVGDLAFSLFKRYYGIKDFGTIMPGHGGVLDRIDSVLFCILFFNAMVMFI